MTGKFARATIPIVRGTPFVSPVVVKGGEKKNRRSSKQGATRMNGTAAEQSYRERRRFVGTSERAVATLAFFLSPLPFPRATHAAVRTRSYNNNRTGNVNTRGSSPLPIPSPLFAYPLGDKRGGRSLSSSICFFPCDINARALSRVDNYLHMYTQGRYEI